jgi:hypothetical protein
VQRKLAKRVKPMSAMLIEKISAAVGSPEGSNRIDSSRPRTDLICRQRGVVGSPREG